MKVPLSALLVGLVAGFLLATLVGLGRPDSDAEDRGGSAGGDSPPARRLSDARALDLSDGTTLGELEALANQSRDRASRARLTLAIHGLDASQLRGVMEELRTKVEDGDPDPETTDLKNRLLTAWMELNPRAAFAWIDSMPSIKRREGLYGTALAGLAETNPREAIALLDSVPEGLSRSGVERRLMWAMTKADPDVALEYYRSNGNMRDSSRLNFLNNLASYRVEAVIPELEKLGPSLRGSSWAAENIFKKWANQDLDAVKAYIESAETDIFKSAAIEAAAGKLARTDPAAALDMVGPLDGKAKVVGMKAVYEAWLDHQPSAALASLAGIEDRTLRDQISLELVEDMGYRDPRSAVGVAAQMEDGPAREDAINRLKWSMARMPFDEQEKLIGQLPDADKGELLANMASELVRTDVERGITIFMRMSEEDRLGSAGAEFIGSLSRADPDRALAMADEMPTASAKNDAIRRIMGNLSAEDPEKAAGFIDRLEGEPHAQAVGALARVWAERDSDAAMAWAKGLAGEDRVQALVSISARQSERSPSEAAAVFESVYASAPDDMTGKLRDSAHQIAQNYAKEDGPAAAEWAATLGKESVAKGAVAATMQVWAGKDLTAASEWTNALDDGPIRDSAVRPIVWHLQDDEPGIAIEWADSIADRNSRTSTLRSTFKNWQDDDPGAAREGLENAGLDQATYAELIKLFE